MGSVVVVGAAPIARLGVVDLLRQAGIACRPGDDAAGASTVVLQLDDPAVEARLSAVRDAAPRARVVAVAVDRPVLRVARRPTTFALRCARDRPLTAVTFVEAIQAALAATS